MKPEDISANGTIPERGSAPKRKRRGIVRRFRQPPTQQLPPDSPTSSASGIPLGSSKELSPENDSDTALIAYVKKHALKTRGVLAAWRRLMMYLTYNIFSKEITPARKKLLEKEQARWEGEKAIAEQRKLDIREDVIPRRDANMEQLETEIEEYKDGTRKDEDTFNQGEFYIGSALLGMGVCYLIYYYMNAFFSAFVRNFADALEDGDLDVLSQTVFHPNFLGEVNGSTFWFLLLACAVLLMGAFSLHIAAQKKDAFQRRVSIAAVCGAIFGIDYVIAFVIGGKLYLLRQITGLIESDQPWSLGLSLTSSDVWLILCFGFLPALFAGWILIHLFRLRAKPNPIKVRMEQVGKMKAEKEAAEYELEQCADKAKAAEEAIRRIQREIEGSYFNLNYVEGRLSLASEAWIDVLESLEDDTEVFERKSDAVDESLHAFLEELNHRHADIDASKS